MHLLKWLYPGMRFKRWLCLFAVGALLTGLGLAIVFNYKYIDSIEEFLFSSFFFRPFLSVLKKVPSSYKKRVPYCLSNVFIKM